VIAEWTDSGRRVGRIVRLFKWAVRKELVPPTAEPHAGEPLNLNQGGDLFRYVGQDRIDKDIGDRLDRIGLAGLGSADLQAVNRLQRLVHPSQRQPQLL
jgi:hypothetical protein